MKTKIYKRYFKTKLVDSLEEPYSDEERADFICDYNYNLDLFVDRGSSGIYAWEFINLNGNLTFLK